MEQKQLRASIIIRAYNAEKTIVRALKSALLQTTPSDEYEILIVDDGSTDGTGEILARYEGEPNVRIIKQANEGIVGASNAGFSNSRGLVTLLLDADDEAMQDFVAEATAPFADQSIDYAYGEYFEEYDGSVKRVLPEDPFKALAGAFAWRREKLHAEGGFGGNGVFPEYELLLRTWGRWKGVPIHKPLFIYHRSKKSMTGDKNRVEDTLSQLLKQYPEREAEIHRIRSYAL